MLLQALQKDCIGACGFTSTQKKAITWIECYRQRWGMTSRSVCGGACLSIGDEQTPCITGRCPSMV